MLRSGFTFARPRRSWAGFCAAVLLAITPALAQAAPATGRWVRFAQGKAEVQLPSKLLASEGADGKLTATFGPANPGKLELVLLDHEKDAAPEDTAEQYVEFYAQQRKLPVHSDGDKAVVMEGAEATVGGKPYRIARWQIGFGKSIVVMTLTAPVEKTIPPVLKEFLDQDLEQVIKSVRRRS